MKALQTTEYEVHKDYINKLHHNSKGWITKAKIKDKQYSQRHYKLQDLLMLENLHDKNTYISMNTFYNTYRRIEYLKELKALYIDLDLYNLGLTKEKALMNLEENYYNSIIPIPSLTIDSGRGLYLIWLIDTVPSKVLPLWSAIQDFLYKQLKDFGADRKALDCTRILRLVGSINSNSNSEVKVIDEYDYVYGLREIQENYLPELKPKEKRKGRPTKLNFIYRERSLYYARLQDLKKLCEIREYDLRGHREVILFLYRYWCCYFTEDIEKALQDVLELNNMFIYPLSEKEVIRATRSAEKVYKDNNKQYKYKNTTLIELLDITDDEQIHMSTIIADAEYKRRKRIRNHIAYQEQLNANGKLSKKEAIEIRIKKIKTLKNQGLTNKQIAQELELNIKTLERNITYMKKNGLLQ